MIKLNVTPCDDYQAAIKELMCSSVPISAVITMAHWRGVSGIESETIESFYNRNTGELLLAVPEEEFLRFLISRFREAESHRGNLFSRFFSSVFSMFRRLTC